MANGSGDPVKFGRLGYDMVILTPVKTAISVPDETFGRVDAAAKRMRLSRSEFYSRAAERWLRELDDADVTEAINDVLAGTEPEHGFTDAAAAAIASRDAD